MRALLIICLFVVFLPLALFVIVVVLGALIGLFV